MKQTTSMRAIALLSLGIGGSAVALSAQESNLVGRWTCEQANYTVRNSIADNFTISWIMELRSDGTLIAEGRFFASATGYPEGIQGQGRWGATEQGLALGIEWLLAGQQPIPAEYNLRNAGTQMVENGRGPAGQYSTSCQRAGG